MKNFKKIIILAFFVLGVVIYIVYKIISNNQYEKIELENFTNNEIEQEIEEKEYIVLHITGEVLNPGIIKIEEGARVWDAIDKAGGITEKANLDKINLAYVLSDGQKLYIPSVYDEEEKEIITEDIGQNIIEDFTVKTNNKININTATQTELEALSGIGPSTALKIINYRKENGKFKNIEEIKNVPGIGESKFKQIENQICV